MDEFYGVRYVINPIVQAGSVARWNDRVWVFNNRHDVIRFVYWSRLGPILDRLAGEAAVRWERAKYEQSRTDSVRSAD